MGPIVKKKTDNKNCPLGNSDIGFSWEFKTSVFNSLQRIEQKHDLNELTHRDSHKGNTTYKKRNENSIYEKSNNWNLKIHWMGQNSGDE